MTADEAKEVLPVVLRSYAGGECQGCHHTLDTDEDLRTAVWWPWEKGRVGHPACFAAHFAANKISP